MILSIKPKSFLTEVNLMMILEVNNQQTLDQLKNEYEQMNYEAN